MTGQTGLAVSRDGSNNGTTPKGFRLAIGSLLAKATTGIDVRKGIMWDGGGPVVTGTASMAYSVRACVAAVMPSAVQGPILVPNDAALSVATTAAPGSNSRIDVIWVRQHLVAADGGSDSDVIGEFGCTQGTAAASPVAPAIPSGAVEIARATVPTGTTQTNSLTISQTHMWTAPVGAAIPVRDNTERAALTAFDGLIVNNLTSKRLEKYNGSTSAWDPILSGDSGWQNCTSIAPFTANGVQVRKLGTLVIMRGYVTRATGSSSSLTDAVQLPAGYWPPVDHYFGPGQPNVAVGVRGAVGASNGRVQLAMETANANGMGVATSWTTD